MSGDPNRHPRHEGDPPRRTSGCSGRGQSRSRSAARSDRGRRVEGDRCGSGTRRAPRSPGACRSSPAAEPGGGGCLAGSRSTACRPQQLFGRPRRSPTKFLTGPPSRRSPSPRPPPNRAGTASPAPSQLAEPPPEVRREAARAVEGADDGVEPPRLGQRRRRRVPLSGARPSDDYVAPAPAVSGAAPDTVRLHHPGPPRRRPRTERALAVNALGRPAPWPRAIPATAPPKRVPVFLVRGTRRKTGEVCLCEDRSARGGPTFE